MVEVDYYIIYSAECPKNMSFFGKMAITTFKIMQNAKVGGVLQNSGYLLQDGQLGTEMFKLEEEMRPKGGMEFTAQQICTPLMFCCLFMTCTYRQHWFLLILGVPC